MFIRECVCRAGADRGGAVRVLRAAADGGAHDADAARAAERVPERERRVRGFRDGAAGALRGHERGARRHAARAPRALPRRANSAAARAERRGTQVHLELRRPGAALLLLLFSTPLLFFCSITCSRSFFRGSSASCGMAISKRHSSSIPFSSGSPSSFLRFCSHSSMKTKRYF